jgi:hypothetical protein
MLSNFLRFQNILTEISSQNLADKAAPGSPDNPTVALKAIFPDFPTRQR